MLRDEPCEKVPADMPQVVRVPRPTKTEHTLNGRGTCLGPKESTAFVNFFLILCASVAYLASVYLSDLYFSLSVPFIRQVFVVAHVFFFSAVPEWVTFLPRGHICWRGPHPQLARWGLFSFFEGSLQ